MKDNPWAHTTFSFSCKINILRLWLVFRRLLQMGLYNAELFNNLGLCCFYAQQYDMTLSCFQHALSLAKDDDVADIWYNIGLIAIVSTIMFHKIYT